MRMAMGFLMGLSVGVFFDGQTLGCRLLHVCVMLAFDMAPTRGVVLLPAHMLVAAAVAVGSGRLRALAMGLAARSLMG